MARTGLLPQPGGFEGPLRGAREHQFSVAALPVRPGRCGYTRSTESLSVPVTHSDRAKPTTFFSRSRLRAWGM